MAVRVFCLVYGSLVVMCQLMTTQASVLECQTPGRFPNPEDCSSYVDCLPDGPDGQLRAREGDCFGFPYSPAERRCVPLDRDTGCATKGLRNSLPVPALQYLCEGTSNVGCIHCRMAYQCIGDNVYVSECEDPDICSENDSFGGGACLPYSVLHSGDNCYCSKTGLISDSYNDTYYMYCDANATPIKIDMFSCAEGETFVDSTGKCEAPQPIEIPPCDGSSATRVNPNDCSYSYTCLPDNSVKTSYCGENKYFYENNGTCVDACYLDISLPTGGALCPDEGNQMDPADCTKYYVCLIPGQEPYASKQCVTGFFDSNENKCVSEPIPSGCIPVDYTKCPGHDQQNCS
ncbi:hypothetical protein OTU49_015505 [Cherax quadricarinatus]|uniref:Chitin-binding type-2 domain-containing protein n=1 Tax=Cherax quadricarinatus TaxID=27406 RepID=A0AAW0XYX4_CHEQU